jgi:SAM-dependent methyltransferase
VVDIGGEGRHAAVINFNRMSRKTCGPRRGDWIPNCVQGRADRLPFADRVVDLVLVECTPLSRQALHEIRRIIKPEGLIVLRHARPFGRDPHVAARAILGGNWAKRDCLVGQRACQETLFFLGAGRSMRRDDFLCDLLKRIDCEWPQIFDVANPGGNEFPLAGKAVCSG